MTQLGYAKIATGPDAFAHDDFAFTGPYTLAGGGRAADLQLYLKGGPNSSAVIRCAIYTRTIDGVWHFVPGSASSELTIPQNSPAAWRVLPIPGRPILQDGETYWIAMWFGPGWPGGAGYSLAPNYFEDYGLGPLVYWDSNLQVPYSATADPPATKVAPQSYGGTISVYVDVVPSPLRSGGTQATTPHFSLPFRFQPQAALSEQDSVEEIADCALSVLLCPIGYRVELPDFGIEDTTFSSPLVDTDMLREAIDTWEPRASTHYDQTFEDVLTARIGVYVQVRTGE